MNTASTKLLSKSRELRNHFASPQDQAGADLLQALPQAGETMMKPPPLGSSDMPWSRRDIVKDVDWDDWPFRGCHSKRGLVVQTEILPEPNNRGC
jgi:hypothetical protein